MNILKSICKYFNSKLIYFVIIIGIPAIVAGLCISGQGILELVVNYGNYNFESFLDVYLLILNRPNVWLYLQPLAFIAIALGLSLLYATIDSHMRMGEFSVRDVIRKIDYNFLACAKFVFVLAITGHLMMLLTAVLTFMYNKITMNVGLAWTLTACTTIVLGILYLSIITLLMMWLPTMLHTGVRSNRAFVMGVKQISPVFVKTLLTITLPIVPYFAIMILNCYFGWGIGFVFDILCFVFFGIWLVVTMNTVYYDLNSIEREDLKSIIWSKKF